MLGYGQCWEAQCNADSACDLCESPWQGSRLEQRVLQVLTYGIASAAVLRLVVIGLGTELVDNFQIVNLGFAAFLIFNAWQMVTAGNGEEEDLADKWIVKACRC